MKLGVVLSVFLTALPAGSAAAAKPETLMAFSGCGKHLPMLVGLLDRHGEQPMGLGPTAGGSQVWELLVDPDDRSWTLLAVFTDGKACLVASGKSWELVPGWGEPG